MNPKQKIQVKTVKNWSWWWPHWTDPWLLALTLLENLLSQCHHMSSLLYMSGEETNHDEVRSSPSLRCKNCLFSSFCCPPPPPTPSPILVWTCTENSIQDSCILWLFFSVWIGCSPKQLKNIFKEQLSLEKISYLLQHFNSLQIKVIRDPLGKSTYVLQGLQN